MLISRNGHTGCIEEGGKRFASWIDNMENYVPPNLRNLVYRYGMGARGDSAAWDEMLKRFMAEKNPAEKRKLLYGLGTRDEFTIESNGSGRLIAFILSTAFTREPWILSQFLNLAGNETIVRQQDFFIAVKYVATNPIGKFVQLSWSMKCSKFPFTYI